MLHTLIHVAQKCVSVCMYGNTEIHILTVSWVVCVCVTCIKWSIVMNIVVTMYLTILRFIHVTLHRHTRLTTLSECVFPCLYTYTQTRICDDVSRSYSILYMMYVGVYREGKSERKREKESVTAASLLPPDLWRCMSLHSVLYMLQHVRLEGV